MAQFAQCFRFDLADTLAGDIELFADFFERVVGVHIDAEAHAQHLGFARSQTSEHLASRLTQAFDRRGVDRRRDRRVFDEVAQV